MRLVQSVTYVAFLCAQGWYLYLVTVRWFGLRIDLLSSMFLAAVAFFSVPLASRKSSSWWLRRVLSLANKFERRPFQPVLGNGTAHYFTSTHELQD